jgi:hypothetical protein
MQSELNVGDVLTIKEDKLAFAATEQTAEVKEVNDKFALITLSSNNMNVWIEVNELKRISH